MRREARAVTTSTSAVSAGIHRSGAGCWEMARFSKVTRLKTAGSPNRRAASRISIPANRPSASWSSAIPSARCSVVTVVSLNWMSYTKIEVE